MQKIEVQHVFLVGAKLLGAYGGYETFINKLTEYHQNSEKTKYHVACKANGDGSMDPYKTEGARVIYYDVAALHRCCEIIKRDKISHPIVYVTACWIGSFMKYFYDKIHSLVGKACLNPDGMCEIIWPTRNHSDFMRVCAA